MPFVLAAHRAQHVRHIQRIAHPPRFTGYYSSKSNRLFMSVSFMGEPEEGRLAARNFSTLAVPPRNSSAVPTMVTMRPFFAVNARTPCVLLVVLVFSSEVLKLIKR